MLASHSGKIVTGSKLSFSELSRCIAAVKWESCAWRMLHMLAFHTVEYECRLENVFAIY